MWFKELTGFEEISPENVKNNLQLKGENLISLVNKEQFLVGQLEIPTLEKLRGIDLNDFSGKIKIQEIVADVKELHCDIKNKDALFQVASQFNLLEMIHPNITPELGIERYIHDRTQGPICAIACAAGTIFRNYFVEVNGKIGQTENNQIDCLVLIGKELDNENLNLWQMKNGYAMVNQNGLLSINKKLHEFSCIEREKLKGKLQIGIQWNTEVTISKSKHTVSQIYCSALPVAYSTIEFYYWESFSRLILEAAYEATLYAALLNMKNNHSNIVYLTLLGGGAFGNEEQWILDSLKMALSKFANTALDIRIVSYGYSNPNVKQLIKEIA